MFPQAGIPQQEKVNLKFHEKTKRIHVLSGMAFCVQFIFVLVRVAKMREIQFLT